MSKRLDSRYFPLILDVLEAGVFTIDEHGVITSFNQAAERITGFKEVEVLGMQCSAVFRTNLCETMCPLRTSISTGRAVRKREVHVKGKDGRPIPISVSTAPLATEDGRMLGGVEVVRDLSQIVDLKRRLTDEYHVEDIIGKSPAMRRLFDLLPLLANSDSNVMITGASGTGKELVARTIHQLGQRSKKKFVPINCAAIPETLLESELFGYKKGAFTDARRDKPGRVAAAEGGTLFLDEVGDLPGVMQVKVLRFLQDRVYEPLGSNERVTANVRVLAATNQPLDELVRNGAFREDLYYRLNVVQLEIPPLAERVEDIPLLVNHYVGVFRNNTGKPIEGLSDAAMAILVAHPFPGNVRELENIIERAFILCQGGRIEVDHLPPDIIRGTGVSRTTTTSSTMDAAKVESIRNALERHSGNRTRAAADLGVHRSTLLRMMKRYGIN